LAGVVAGDKHPGYPYLQIQANKSAAAWARGDCLYVASNAWLKAPTTATTSPFGVAAQAQVSGDTKGSVVLEGVIAMTAGATIAPFVYVQSDTTTAGRVMTWAGTLGNAIVGLYIGKADQMDGNTVQANASAGDVIWVKLGLTGGVAVS
jgi:hypothetical protein